MLRSGVSIDAASSSQVQRRLIHSSMRTIEASTDDYRLMVRDLIICACDWLSTDKEDDTGLSTVDADGTDQEDRDNVL